MTLTSKSWIVLLSLTLQGVALAQLHEVSHGSSGPVKAAHLTAELKARTYVIYFTESPRTCPGSA
jgi:hypothetical protein